MRIGPLVSRKFKNHGSLVRLKSVEADVYICLFIFHVLETAYFLRPRVLKHHPEVAAILPHFGSDIQTI